MYISKEDKERILSSCDDKIVETITAFGALKKSGSGYTANCPCCGSENGLSINPSKNEWPWHGFSNGSKMDGRSL